ncbi:MAG: hypothetical protein Q8P02_04135 [Candidatus Micrarchaeota archaeon]|nr:hypothetical protein [Candidatus Micrarchaeota archaeon]
MPEPFRIHRYRVGRARVIGFEIPEREKNREGIDEFARHWSSIFSVALASAHARLRPHRGLRPPVARELESLFAKKDGPDFLTRIKKTMPSRRGNVLLTFRLPAGMKEIELDALKNILAENPNLFYSSIVVRKHPLGSRP